MVYTGKSQYSKNLTLMLFICRLIWYSHAFETKYPEYIFFWTTKMHIRLQLKAPQNLKRKIRCLFVLDIIFLTSSWFILLQYNVYILNLLCIEFFSRDYEIKTAKCRKHYKLWSLNDASNVKFMCISCSISWLEWFAGWFLHSHLHVIWYEMLYKTKIHCNWI